MRVPMKRRPRSCYERQPKRLRWASIRSIGGPVRVATRAGPFLTERPQYNPMRLYKGGQRRTRCAVPTVQRLPHATSVVFWWARQYAALLRDVLALPTLWPVLAENPSPPPARVECRFVHAGTNRGQDFCARHTLTKRVMDLTS